MHCHNQLRYRVTSSNTGNDCDAWCRVQGRLSALYLEKPHPQCSESTMRLSEDVEYISLHKPLPFVLQGYVWPFVLLYAALLGVWIGVYGFLEYTEAFLIGFAIIAGLNVVTCLFGVWSVHVRCALTCSKVKRNI